MTFKKPFLGLQSRFGDNWEQITRNMRYLSPKPYWRSKGLKDIYIIAVVVNTTEVASESCVGVRERERRKIPTLQNIRFEFNVRTDSSHNWIFFRCHFIILFYFFYYTYVFFLGGKKSRKQIRIFKFSNFNVWLLLLFSH